MSDIFVSHLYVGTMTLQNCILTRGYRSVIPRLLTRRKPKAKLPCSLCDIKIAAVLNSESQLHGVNL